MNPPRKTTGLFLTRRGPYGQRLPEHARKYLRAAEDEKTDSTRKDMQGLPGQSGPDQIAERARIESEMGKKERAPQSAESDQP